MSEIWKPCVGFEGFYEVSNFGNVRSIAVYIDKYKRVCQRKSPVLKALETTREGYKRVLLSLYGKHHHCAVHRLVGMAFIPNENNLPEINHKDENPANNKVENLEWCTRKYNANYGTLPNRISGWQTNSPVRSKAIYQYTKDGEFITAYPSLNEAGRCVGVSGDMIGRVCKGKAKSAAGFIFKFAV